MCGAIGDWWKGTWGGRKGFDDRAPHSWGFLKHCSSERRILSLKGEAVINDGPERPPKMQTKKKRNQTNKSKPVSSPDPLFLDLLRCGMFRDDPRRNVGGGERAENQPHNETREQMDTAGRDDLLIFSVGFGIFSSEMFDLKVREDL